MCGHGATSFFSRRRRRETCNESLMCAVDLGVCAEDRGGGPPPPRNNDTYYWTTCVKTRYATCCDPNCFVDYSDCIVASPSP